MHGLSFPCQRGAAGSANFVWSTFA
jgi:hypothetical protein